MNDLFARVTTWNAARYEQEDNPYLTVKLLKEEVTEFIEDDNLKLPEEVDRLDALMDIVYVAIGGAWKMGLSSHQIEESFKAVCDANDTKVAKKTASDTKANIDKGTGFIAPEPRLQEILDGRT